jgi:polyisoprenoid-binding protein YceI
MVVERVLQEPGRFAKKRFNWMALLIEKTRINCTLIILKVKTPLYTAASLRHKSAPGGTRRAYLSVNSPKISVRAGCFSVYTVLPFLTLPLIITGKAATLACTGICITIKFLTFEMKKTTFLLAFILVQYCAFAQSVWTLDKAHSKIGFTVTHHMISEVDGYFADYEGTITTTKEDFSDAVFELTIKTASLTTNFEMRDNHLKSADIFDVEKYPTITFKSTSLVQIAGNRYKLSGNLTMKSTTLPIALDVTIVGPGKNDRAKRFEIGVKGIGRLSRLAYGIGQNLDTFSVSDDVELRILGEFDKPY